MFWKIRQNAASRIVIHRLVYRFVYRQDEYHDASVHLWIFPPLYMHYVLLYFQYNYLKYGLVLPINNLLLGLYQFTALILKLPDSNISLHMQCKGFTTKATAGIFDIFQSERKRIGLWQYKILIRFVTSINTVYIIVDVTSPIVQDHRRQGKANMYYWVGSQSEKTPCNHVHRISCQSPSL